MIHWPKSKQKWTCKAWSLFLIIGAISVLSLGLAGCGSDNKQESEAPLVKTMVIG